MLTKNDKRAIKEILLKQLELLQKYSQSAHEEEVPSIALAIVETVKTLRR